MPTNRPRAVTPGGPSGSNAVRSPRTRQTYYTRGGLAKGGKRRAVNAGGSGGTDSI